MPLSPQTYFDLERFSHQKLWLEGDPVWAALTRLQHYLDSWKEYRIESAIPEGVHLVNCERIAIGKGVIVEPGAYIAGPCVIGSGSAIRHGAYIRGGVILGEGCSVGHAAEIKHSILFEGAAATHFTYVGDSILGHGVNLGAGVKCANLRLDKSNVAIKIDGQKVPTGLRKLGAIVGDGCQVGCNSVLNPGTLLERGCIVQPLSVVSGRNLSWT